MSQHKPDHATLQQAAHWYAQLQASNADAATQTAWRAWYEQGDMQRQAWQYVERIGQRFAPLRDDGDGALQALERARSNGHSRRQVLRAFSVLGGGALLGWATWQGTPLSGVLMAWRADYRSGIGEIRQIALADGTRVWLNGTSALDTDYRGGSRQLRLLRGEVLIDTASDSRPFFVDTEQGRLQALGTNFSVQLLDGQTRLNVFEGAVRVRTHDGSESRVVQAGQQLVFSGTRIDAPQPASLQRQSWSKGNLVADDTTLGQLIDELQAHHRGHLGLAPEIANLRVMGTYPLGDSDQVLDMLESVLPIRVQRPLPWWTTVEAR